MAEQIKAIIKTDDVFVVHVNDTSIIVPVDNNQISVPVSVGSLSVVESQISHLNIQDIGTNAHAAIDTHIADTTIHYTQAGISITASQVSDFTEAAQDAVNSSAMTDSSSIDFSYND